LSNKTCHGSSPEVAGTPPIILLPVKSLEPVAHATLVIGVVAVVIVVVVVVFVVISKI